MKLKRADVETVSTCIWDGRKSWPAETRDEFKTLVNALSAARNTDADGVEVCILVSTPRAALACMHLVVVKWCTCLPAAGWLLHSALVMLMNTRRRLVYG
jgi:hypothetical protein